MGTRLSKTYENRALKSSLMMIKTKSTRQYKRLRQTFSEMYAAVERDLKGRIIKVELKDDGIWIYELKLNHEKTTSSK